MIRDFHKFDSSLSLDNYEFEEIICYGENYNVFRVIDKKSQNEFALRILKISQDEEKLCYKIIYNLKIYQFSSIVKIFQYQDFIAKRSIPYILIESLEDDNFDKNIKYVFITEEFMKNGDIDHLLYQYIKTNGRRNEKMNPTIRSKIIFCVASTIKSLHKRNILHKQIDTSHVFLDDNLEPLISYCQLLKNSNEFETSQIPPENEMTQQTDVYFYSIFLYRMFSNSIKYEYDINNVEILKRPKNISDKFWTLILNCHKEKPEERPTFNQIIEWLKDDMYAIEEYGMKTDLVELHKYHKKLDDDEFNILNQFSSLVNKI